MYLTEMIKALPTQSGRYLAPAAALSHVLKRQQHRPKIRHWLQGKKHSKVNREASAKFPKGAFSACLLGPMFLSTGQQGSRIDSRRHQPSLSNQGTPFFHLHTKKSKSNDLVPRVVMVMPPVLGSCRLPGGHLLRTRKLLSVHSWQLLTLSLYSHSFTKRPGLKLKRK